MCPLLCQPTCAWWIHGHQNTNHVTATETIEDSASGRKDKVGGQLIVYTCATSHVTATETIEDSASGRKDKVGGQLIVYTCATSHVTATETIEDSASGRKDQLIVNTADHRNDITKVALHLTITLTIASCRHAHTTQQTSSRQEVDV